MTDHKSVYINESCGILLYILKFFGARCIISQLLSKSHANCSHTTDAGRLQSRMHMLWSSHARPTHQG
jgi:hypothetical protein